MMACMTTPATASPMPTPTAARKRGKRTIQTTFSSKVIWLVSPPTIRAFQKASRTSITDIS